MQQVCMYVCFHTLAENTKGQYITLIILFLRICLSTTSRKSQENEITAHQNTIVKAL